MSRPFSDSSGESDVGPPTAARIPKEDDQILEDMQRYETDVSFRAQIDRDRRAEKVERAIDGVSRGVVALSDAITILSEIVGELNPRSLETLTPMQRR